MLFAVCFALKVGLKAFLFWLCQRREAKQRRVTFQDFKRQNDLIRASSPAFPQDMRSSLDTVGKKQL